MRVSLWRANGKRCLYCGDFVEYRDLEIDHVIAESTGDAEFERLLVGLGLGADFSLNDTRNLIPTHHDCNRKKSNTQFSESNLRYYLGIWAEKQGKVREELVKFERAAERDDLLTRLCHQIESGALSRDEVGALMQTLRTPQELEVPAPMVLSFGTNCDALSTAVDAERTLIETLRRQFRRPLVPAEPSQFTGETLSVRLAIWSLDVERLAALDLGGWKLLEVEPASELYGNDMARTLASAIEETYNISYAEKHGCPECGGRVIMSGSTSESGELAIGTCEKCGWEDYYS